MANTKAKVANKLNAQVLKGYGLLPAAGASVVPAATPDAVAYNVYGPAQVANLQKQDDQIRGPLSDIALRHGAEQERADYAKALQAAQYGIIQTANNKTQNAMNENLVSGRDADAKSGMAGAYKIIQNADGTSKLQMDPVLGDVNNGRVLNNDQAERYNKLTGGVKNLHDAGVITDASTVNKLLTNPLQPEQETGYGLFNSTGRNAQEQTNEDHYVRADANDATTADAAMVRANKPGSDQPTVTVVPGNYGLPPQVSYRGKPDQVAPYMNADAPHGSPLQPPQQQNKLQAIMQTAVQNGLTVQQAGGNLVVSGGGQSRTYDAQGNRIK